MSLIFAIIIAYLLGSISCAVLVCKFIELPDPRTVGSGNAGATNVLRSGNKGAAALVLLGDVLKGFFAVLIGRLLHLSDFNLGLVAIAATVGHIYPVFFNFKGGKGVATAFGCLLGASFWFALLAAIIWLVVIGVSRYSSLAALSSAVIVPVLMALNAHLDQAVPFFIIAMLLVWRHFDNIERLRNGTEPKIKFGNS